MVEKGFGQNLVDKGVITEEQHQLALRRQNKSRLLGQIAVEEKYMSEEQVEQVNEYLEDHPQLLFGEAAVSLGILTTNQLKYLLNIRTRRKVRIGDILVELGYITSEQLHREVMSFDAKRHRLHRVMLCEPTTTVSKMLKRMLVKYGYSVIETRTGVEAIEKARSDNPDILISSSVLDDISGFELCFKLLSDSHTAHVRPILISSNVDQESVERAFEAGVTHFLKKPVKENELINVVYDLEKEVSLKRPEKILVVDDSPGARIIINKELSAVWSDIVMVENGKEAVETARAIRPDIITMDVEMPVMNGLEACRQLASDPATEDIPVVFVTSMTGAEFRRKGFEVGGVEYFTKPFPPGHLADFLRMLCEARKIQKEKTVLVTEDSRATMHIFKYFLGKNGYRVIPAVNGKEALKSVGTASPDLVITDAFMPEMDGFDLTRNLRTIDRFRTVPVIMVTASSSKDDVLKALAAGATDYLVKPFDESELLARIESHIQRKELWDRLESEKEKLARANEEKDRFISIAAHDLRNPLSSIIGFSELLLDDDYDPETAKEYLKTIHKASEGMLSLLEDLLDISKIESGRVELTTVEGDLCEVILNRVQLAKPLAAKKDIEIHYVPPGRVITTFDMSKMDQVLDNLLSNAIKFSPRGSRVQVMVDDYVSSLRVAVKDEGPGIPEEELKKLFKPFARLSTKPTGGEKSTGLGLSISEKIIAAHGGEIGVDTKVGTGSVFYFTLPKN